MQFSSLDEFFAMGGHGLYVWLSYGFTIVSLILLVYFSLHANKRVRANILKKIQREAKLKKAQVQQQEHRQEHRQGNQSDKH